MVILYQSRCSQAGAEGFEDEVATTAAVQSETTTRRTVCPQALSLDNHEKLSPDNHEKLSCCWEDFVVLPG